MSNTKPSIALLMLTCAIACAAALTGAVGVGKPEEQATRPSARHRVPDGFTIEQVAGEPEVRFPMFAAFDDRGRLFVAESSGLDLYAEISALTRKCRIRLLEDKDGDGRFETARVFAERLVFPMGLAWREGKLYVADPPDLVVLEDTDGDDRADKRTVMLTGFGHKDNGSLHGLIFGPDGWLYMTMGCPDGYRLKRADGSVLEGESGALIRCRPDGSDPQVLARGFVNLVEVAFTPRGEIIGTDNWFLNVNQKGSGGLRDALVHVVEGGLYPYHPEVGTPQPVTGEPLGPVALFPAVALSGLTRYEGSIFPAEMRGNLFSAQHNARKVGRHVLVPDGSTFRTQDFDFVTSDDPDFHPSDVLETEEGDLLVIDTGSWYVHHCPTGQIRPSLAPGGIYRVRRKNSKSHADPWGLKENWTKASLEQLCVLLGDDRPAVRDRARRTLAARGKEAVPALIAVAGRSTPATRQQAVWALANILDDASLPPLRQALAAAEPDVSATAARALAARADRQAGPLLCRRLTDEAPAVRFAAAEALAHCGTSESLPALWAALTRQPDRFLEHALICALHRLAQVADLERALHDSHPRVQKTAMLLLSQPPRPRDRLAHETVTARAASADAELRQTALNILRQRPEWAAQTTTLVRGWLQKATLTAEERLALSGIVLAFQARPAIQEIVADAIRNPEKNVPTERRVLVLEIAAQCGLARLPAAWVSAAAGAMKESDPAVRAAAVRTAAVWRAPELEGELTHIADNKTEPTELRLEALRAVTARRRSLSADSFALLLGQLKPAAGPLARLTAAEILGRAPLDDRQRKEVLKAVRGDALISPALLLAAFEGSMSGETAAAWSDYLANALRGGWKPTEPELRRLLHALPAEALAQAQMLEELWRQGAERQRAQLADFEPLLKGGNPQRGRTVFFDKRVACSACHRLGNEGGDVGPDLTRIGTVRSGRDLLESVVLPSASVAQGFENYAIATKDDRLLTGVIVRQTADVLVLREASGGEQRLTRDSIDEMKRQATSLMPDGLPRAVSREEFRDLLAFLQSLR